MAPTRSKKRKSTESTSSVDIQNFPAPPQLVPTKMSSPRRSPIRSPMKKGRMGITLSQKQALIDNLQLEVTERARKLRAQYMLQAQGLRARVEIRVNRIPVAMRKVKMGDLVLKHSTTSLKSTTVAGPSQMARSPAKNLLQESRGLTRQSPSPQRNAKRLSDQMSSTDKENEDIENPKKRPRGPPAPPARTTSKLDPAQILSPRSANSRTLPRSPIRPPPSKSMLARPLSPLKPAAPVPTSGAAGMLSSMVERAKTTRATAAARKVTANSNTSSSTGVGRGKRPAPAAAPPKVRRGRPSNTSESSDASTGTTIVKKKPAAAKKEPVKKSMMSTIKGMGSTKRAPAAKATAAPTGGRVLRKRN